MLKVILSPPTVTDICKVEHETAKEKETLQEFLIQWKNM